MPKVMGSDKPLEKEYVPPSADEEDAFKERLLEAQVNEEKVAPPNTEGREIVWYPQDGSQVTFLQCPLFEALYHGTRGGGKALSFGEPVMTPFGELSIEKLHVGSIVLCPDGTRSQVIGVFPQGKQPVFEITFDDGAKARCDIGHIWPIHVQQEKTKRPYPYRLLTMDKVLEKFEKGRRLHIPTIDEPVSFMKRNAKLLVEPYLLGLLLGDGCFTQGRASLCTQDEEIAEHALLMGMKKENTASREVLNFMGSRELKDAVKKLGLGEHKSDDKFVPKQYLESEIKVRLAVLQGLMDTDGTVDKEGRIGFGSNSKKLCENMAYLVRSFGGKATMNSRMNYLGTKLFYELYIQTAGKFVPFRLERKIKRLKSYGYQHEYLRRRITNIEYLGKQKTVCIKIDHPLGLFITRDFVVTHNSDTLLWAYGQHVGKGYGADWRGIIFRQTYPQLADIQAKSEKWFRRVFPEAEFNKTRMMWSWPTGETLLLRHILRPSDYWNYHGHAYQMIGFEELTNWPTPECYTQMMSCCRSSNPGVPLMVRANSNPYGPGHNWVKERFGLGGKWWETIIIKNPRNAGGEIEPDRCAIYSHIDENKILLNATPDYRHCCNEQSNVGRLVNWPLGHRRWWNVR